MSLVALKENYVLHLPVNYVDIKIDEAEYINGRGGSYYNMYYWGVACRISKQDCNDIAAAMGVGAGAAAIAAALSAPTGAGPAIAGAVSGLLTMGCGYFWMAGNHNGIYAEYNLALGFSSQIQW